MNVLSLFDGMSCGQLALQKAGIEVEQYFASEVDKYAIKVSTENFPEMIHLGDVTKIDCSTLPKIDLLIGGSPCQGFSFAGKQLNFNDPRSKLFFDFIRIKNKLNPKYFMLENVVMRKESIDVITKLIGVEPVKINSALVSAQNRNRLYWTNIPFYREIQDQLIFLKDILEPFPEGAVWLSESTVSRFKGYGVKPVASQTSKARCLSAMEYVKNGKQGNYVLHQRARGFNKGGSFTEKSPTLTSNSWEQNHCIEVGHADINGHDFLKRVYHSDGKSPTLTAVCGGNQERKVAIDGSRWRKLTVLECKRLQTVPDDYKMNVSNSQAYKMLGNGWTVDVVAHILKGLKQK